MIEITTIAQTVSVMSACWAIISGVGAWKREFVGKRRIELAEQVLAQFYTVVDAIAYIRNPFTSSDEGRTRKRNPGEMPFESELLDRGYIVVERYAAKETVFSEFAALKYKFMAAFGKDSGAIFTETLQTINSIFVSARMLAHHYWKRQGRVRMEPDVFDRHLEEMHRHEGIFWDTGSHDDEILLKLMSIQSKLEKVTAPLFEESMQTFSWLTRKWWKSKLC